MPSIKCLCDLLGYTYTFENIAGSLIFRLCTSSVIAACYANCLYVFILSLYTQPSSCLEGAVTEIGRDETPSEVRVFCNVRDGATTADAVTVDGDNGTAAARDDDDRSPRSVYCKLTLPRDAKTLSLAYGRGTARYAYHGTSYNDCGVSFPKPARRSEVGRWKCANAMSDGRVYGGFVTVAPPSNSTTGKPNTRYGASISGTLYVVLYYNKTYRNSTK